jgi:LPXTG-motif cell wall-anchored protein
MKQFSDFALWSGLVVTGSWSTMILMTLVAAFVLGAGASLLHMTPPSAEHLGDYAGTSCMVVALLSVFVGVPILAWRHRVGFWRGLIVVIIAAGWLVLSAAALLALVLSDQALTFLAAAGLNFLIAVVLGVILRRRRRAKRLEPERIGDVFS